MEPGRGRVGQAGGARTPLTAAALRAARGGGGKEEEEAVRCGRRARVPSAGATATGCIAGQAGNEGSGSPFRRLGPGHTLAGSNSGFLENHTDVTMKISNKLYITGVIAPFSVIVLFEVKHL